MHYQIRSPDPRLAAHVESIWVQEDCSSPVQRQDRPTRILPTARPCLAIYFWDPFLEVSGGHSRLMPRCSLYGQRTRPIEVTASGRSGVLVVNFLPWGASSLFHQPIDDLTDRWVELQSAAGEAPTSLLEERIQSAACPEERLRVLEEFLFGLASGGDGDPIVLEAASRLDRSGGRLSISELARRLGYGRRHLSRRFKERCGVGPKTFARIVRFQKALDCKKAGMDWGEIAERYGYYDQAHFIKEVRAFSGCTPERLFSNREETSLMTYFNGGQKSHFYNTTYL